MKTTFFPEITIRRIQNSSALFLLAFFLVAPLSAAPILSATQASYSNLNPGDSFVLTLSVVNPDLSPSQTPIIYGYDYALQANADGIFSVTGQTLFSPVNSSQNLAGFPFAVTMTSTNDFGATAGSNFTSGFGAGTSLAQTLTVQIAPTVVAGNYTLSLGFLGAGPDLVDTDGNEYQAASPILISVAVIPEPGTAFLTGFASIALLQGSRKRRSSET